jgi:hypothetical protein
VEPQLGKGHVSWMNSFYSAPALDVKLKFMKSNCDVTLHLNRKDMPKITEGKELKKKESEALPFCPLSVLQWCDKEMVP